MNKKLSIFAIILVIVGTIGTIWSGITTMPYLMNTALSAEKEINKEHTIYNEEINVNKLDIYTKTSNIIIKKHDKKNVIINGKGKSSYVRYDINSNDGSLFIKEIDNDRDLREKIKDLEDLINLGIENIFLNDIQSIVVYVPNDVDINVITEGGDLKVEDDVFLDNLIFKTYEGRISLPEKFKDLNSLKIISKQQIYLSMAELIGIKNVSIESSSVDIYSNAKDIFIDNIEEYIPEKVNISKSTNDSSNYGININTDIPVAKDLTINTYNLSVDLSLPIEKYKINFDIKSLQKIDLTELIEKNILDENDSRAYQDIREIKGILNNQLANLENEYKVNVKSEYINIY